MRLEDQLTAPFLQLRAFGVSVPERIDLSNQQVGALAGDRAALLRSLEDLAQAVAARRADLEPRIAQRRADVLALDRQVQGAEFKAGIGVYAAVGAPAVAPDTPAYPRPALNLGVGAVLGVVGAVAVATVLNAFRGPLPEAAPMTRDKQAVGRIVSKVPEQ